MYRLVVDTSVTVSASISIGKPHQLLREILFGGKCTVVMSDEIISEIREVLGRPKFRLGENDINDMVLPLESLSDIIETKSKLRVVKEDQDDDMFVNAAFDGRADYIVSGDHHLLDLKEYRGIKVVTATEMLGILQSDC